MKKVLMLAAVAAFAFGSTSCKKDYTCDCTYNGENVKLEYKGIKKKDAESACDGAQATYKLADSAAKCSLK